MVWIRSWFVLLLSTLFPEVFLLLSLPSCNDPMVGANTTCPQRQLCWKSGSQMMSPIRFWVNTTCSTCKRTELEPRVVQENETVLFSSDGSFSPDMTLYLFSESADFIACDFKNRTRTLPISANSLLPGRDLAVLPSLFAPGVNLIGAVHTRDPFNGDLCQLGGRINLTVASFECSGSQNASSVCNSRGPCVYKDTLTAFMCDCPSGFYGAYCQEIDECYLNTACKNGGTCVDAHCDFNCSCLTGSEGQFCENTDCRIRQCQNGGHCFSGPGSVFSCNCSSGYAGDFCELDIDECSAGTHSCDPNSSCTNTFGGYQCRCFTGFLGDGFQCVDINECSVGMHSCDPMSSCINTPGGYQCRCSTGFQGNGFQCFDIDECVTLPCTSQLCVNTVGSYRCEQLTCSAQPGICQHGGTCDDFNTGPECSCIPGFTGQYCESIVSACDSFPCLNGATCIQGLAGSFTCSCGLGYLGELCDKEKTNECLSNPCPSNETCQERPTHGYDCYPVTGICRVNPCQNGGICKPGSQTVCFCSPGYYGPYCEYDVHECASNPCENGGTCVDGSNSYMCQCGSGYGGHDCEKVVCKHDTCQNGGTCQSRDDMTSGFACLCMNGYEGLHCQTRINPCHNSPCHNGGVCIAQFPSFHCQCPTGTIGRQCDRVLDKTCKWEPDIVPTPEKPKTEAILNQSAIRVAWTFSNFAVLGYVVELSALGGRYTRNVTVTTNEAVVENLSSVGFQFRVLAYSKREDELVCGNFSEQSNLTFAGSASKLEHSLQMQV